MSQTVVVASPDAAPVAPVTGPPRSRLASGMAALRHALEGSPGRLRLVSAICVIACVLAGLLGGYALQRRSAALDDARASATHLLLLQRVQTQLVEADADATNGYLAFGLEPIANQQDYLRSMRDASQGLAAAADASRDPAAFEATFQALTRYSGYISSARAYNRQQVQVGQSYLTIASTSMRTQIIPGLQTLAAADNQEIDRAYARAGNTRWLLIAAALLGLGGLVLGQVYLTRHSHRLVNAPVAGACFGVIIALMLAAGLMATAQSRANDVRSGDLAKAVAISNARVAAFDAKSLESLTLVTPGASAVYEGPWTAAMKKADGYVDQAGVIQAKDALTGYRAQHARITDLNMTQNNLPAARKLALDNGTNSVNGQFAGFERASQAALSTRSTAATNGLADAGNFLVTVGILVLLIGILTAIAAWYGVSQRLDEYR